MKYFYQFIIWLTNLIPCIKAKRDRHDLAQAFTDEVDEHFNSRKLTRDKCRNHPERATAHDWLYGFGFDPTDEQMTRLGDISITTKANGFRFASTSFIARTMTDKKNLEFTLGISLDKALDIAERYHWGSIRRRKQPSRNEKCRCGSGLKFKNCCIKRFAS